jgi:hypothetical protein
MRLQMLAVLGTALFFSNCQSTFAAIIAVHYTGVYTGGWTGNYNPNNPFEYPAGEGPSSGSLGSGQFSLNLTFDTSRAFPANVTSSEVVSFNTSPVQNNPSAGYATFSGGLGYFISGISSALDQVGAGFTTQRIADYSLQKAGWVITPSLAITAYSPQIPDSIFTPFNILDGLSGTGILSYFYFNTFLGGGIESFSLTPLTLEVQVSGVPETSTWAMLLIGFAGLRFATYRKERARHRHDPAASDTVLAPVHVPVTLLEAFTRPRHFLQRRTDRRARESEAGHMRLFCSHNDGPGEAPPPRGTDRTGTAIEVALLL